MAWERGYNNNKKCPVEHFHVRSALLQQRSLGVTDCAFDIILSCGKQYWMEVWFCSIIGQRAKPLCMTLVCEAHKVHCDDHREAPCSKFQLYCSSADSHIGPALGQSSDQISLPPYPSCSVLRPRWSTLSVHCAAIRTAAVGAGCSTLRCSLPPAPLLGTSTRSLPASTRGLPLRTLTVTLCCGSRDHAAPASGAKWSLRYGWYCTTVIKFGEMGVGRPD